MTAPGGRSDITPGPVQAAVSVDGVSNNALPALDTLDQPTAEALLKSIYIRNNEKLDKPQRDIFSGVRSGIPYSLALIESLVQAIIGAPGQLFLNIGHANGILRLFMGGIQTELTDHTEAIANLNTVTAAMNTTAAYVGDQQDMVTIDRGGLHAPAPRITSGNVKSVDVVSGFGLGAALGVTIGALPVFTPDCPLAQSRGTIYYTPIIVNRKGTIDRLRWIVGADTAIGAINYYEMSLCVYNPANQNIEKVFGSGDIKDGVANTTALKEVSIGMGLNQHVTPGQILFVAHQQVAPGAFQNPRTFAAVPQGGVGREPANILDAWCFTAFRFTQGIPSSIALADLDRENRFVPWSAVTVLADPVGP